MRIRPYTGCALAAFALIACSSRDAGSGPAGGTLIVNINSEAVSVIPELVVEETGRIISDLIFDRLAEIPDDLKTTDDKAFTPRLAKSWEWGPDSLSIAFHLDPAARWHDGRPVTAADVRFTHRLATDTAVDANVASAITSIDSVSVRDSLTAVVWYKHRSPEQFYDFVYQLPIIPEHVYGKVAGKDLMGSEIARAPVGSGRFRFVKWEPNVQFEMIADTANYRGRPKLDRVILKFGQDPNTSATQVAAGQADFYNGYPIDRVAQLDSSTVARPEMYRPLGYSFLAFNLSDRKNPKLPHPIFGDVRLRRAISMALDRSAMLQNVFGKVGALNHGPFPTGLAVADTTVPVPAHDAAAARLLLDSLGWKAGANGMRSRNGVPLRFELLTPSTSLFRSKYAVLIQEQLRAVGVQVDLASVPGNVYNDRVFVRGADYDALMASGIVDPSVSGTKQLWGSDGLAAHTNYSRYAKSSVDALLDSAARAPGFQDMKRYASMAFKQIVDDVPAVWLYDTAILTAVNRRVDVKPYRADGWWAHLDEWSIPAGKRIDRDRIGLGAQR